MKSITRIATALFASAAFLTGAFAADRTTETAASNDYPLTTCAVSGEALGSMGEPYDYIHKEEGKPDRLVRMCCSGCLKTFKKDPAKYLARIDAAKAKANKQAESSAPARSN